MLLRDGGRCALFIIVTKGVVRCAIVTMVTKGLKEMHHSYHGYQGVEVGAP